MEEWDDTVPEWASAEQASELEILSELMEVAEFLCNAPVFSFQGYPGTVEKQDGLEIQTIHLKDFDNIILRLCKSKDQLISMVICPIGHDTPQIILKPPGIFMYREATEEKE
jgi:hypothetical protein